MRLDGLCPLTTADALRRAAATAPDVEAVAAPDGRITFAGLEREVAGIRAARAAVGVRRGDHVGLCLDNAHRFVAVFLAIGSLGAVAVPVNTRFVAPELAYALRQSRISTLITADRFLKVDFIAMLRGICPGIDTGLPDAAFLALRQAVVIGEHVPAAAVSWRDFIAAGDGEVPPAWKTPAGRYSAGSTTAIWSCSASSASSKRWEAVSPPPLWRRSLPASRFSTPSPTGTGDACHSLAHDPLRLPPDAEAIRDWWATITTRVA